MIRLFLAGLIVVFISTAVASAQDTPADPLAYTPTGDALWDTYAQALLGLLEADSVPVAVNGYTPPALTLETLEGWESEFGDDPRYWQLRYWDAVVQPAREGDTWREPMTFLEQAVTNGISDPLIDMLLFERRRDTLAHNWEMYCEGTLPEDSRFAPDISDGAAEFSWYIQQDLALVDELVADCPDESWAWYEHAMKAFEYGEWEAGLADLERGNEAVNNRFPMPFPISFINERVAAGQDCGNKIAADMALQGESAWPMPNYLRLKSQLKNQEVRLLLGAPLSEYEPWHYYTCRLGSMDGADSLQWLTAAVLRGMIVGNLLVQTPEVFTIDQRRDLLSLHSRGYRIREQVRWASEGKTARLVQSFELAYAKYGLDARDEPAADSPFWLTDTGQALERELLLTMYRLHFTEYQAEHGEIAGAVKELFDRLATFDMSTFSWPDEE